MKRYTVNVHYDAIASVRVLAEDEQTAIKKAKDIAFSRSQNEYNFEYNDACVTDEEEYNDTPISEIHINVLAFPFVEYDRDTLDTCSRGELLEIARNNPHVFRYTSFDECMDELRENPEILNNYFLMHV